MSGYEDAIGAVPLEAGMMTDDEREKQRGDTYKARALALFKRHKIWREAMDYSIATAKIWHRRCKDAEMGAADFHAHALRDADRATAAESALADLRGQLAAATDERDSAIKRYAECRGWLRQIATHLGSPDDEDVVKFFMEYRAEFNQNYPRAEEQPKLRGLLIDAEVFAWHEAGCSYDEPDDPDKRCLCGYTKWTDDVHAALAAQPAVGADEGKKTKNADNH